MKTLMRSLSWAMPVLLFTSGALAEPATPTFTYQGQLKQSGAALNEPVDLIVNIYDAENGGSPLYVQEFNGIEVTNGLFSIQVDATPDIFNGETRWLEIGVRFPDSSIPGPFTLLSPREMIAAAPYAAFSLADANWANAGSAITNSGSEFVGINRDYAIGSEYLGVHAPIDFGFGGMYISTEGATAKPFYGYQAGTNDGLHYLDGADGDWHLSLNNTNRFTVTDEGNVGISNTDPQSLLHVGGSYTPTVSGSVARVAGLLAAKGDVVSDGGSLLSRSPSGVRAAVVQLDATSDAGGNHWTLVSNANSSPYGGLSGSLSFYNDAENHFTIDDNGDTRIGTNNTYGKLTIGQSVDSSSGGLTLVNAGTARTFRLWVTDNNVCRMDSGGGTGLIAINANGGDVGIATDSPEAQLHVGSGTDVEPDGGGYLILGPTTGTNIGIDNNEIMARDNGAVSTLHFQADGGTVTIGTSGNATLLMSDTVELESSEGGSDGAQFVMRDAAGSANFEVDAEEGGGGGVAFLRNSLGNLTVEIDSDESDDAALRLFEASGDERVSLRTDVSGAGWASLRGSNGNYNVVMTRENASANHGWIDVSDANGDPQAGAYINSSGNGVIWGDTKSFRVANPRDPETEIWYASLEGPEAGAYIRGTAQLVDGRAVITLPDHFKDVCSHASVTMHLTPRSAQSKGLAFTGVTAEGAIVQELGGGRGGYAFDYLMMDVREGHESFQVIRPKMARSLGAPAETIDGDDLDNTIPDEAVSGGQSGTAAAQQSTDDRLAELTTRLARLEALLGDRDNQTDPESADQLEQLP